METRNLVLAIAGIVLIAACTALAFGWKGAADDAMRQVESCRESRRRRVLDIPRINIGAQTISYRGERIVAIADLGPGSITPLLERLKHDRKGDCDVSHVCLGNIVVIESLVYEGGGVMDRIVRTAWAAGFDVIQAPPRDPRMW